MISIIDKVHLKCDCVDGSIVNGKREQILFSFNLRAPPGYKIIKEPTTVLYKKNTTGHHPSIPWRLQPRQSWFQRGDINIYNSNYQDLIFINIEF